MEENQFSRTEMLIGKENIEKIKSSKVAIFGIGGVGSFVCEGLARAGVQNFILVDDDTISITNINRQIHANHNTIGKYKVDVEKQRILKINPNAIVKTYKIRYMPNDENNIITNDIDYIVDAIDTVTAKIEIILQASKLNIPIISSMGTGNKLNPEMLEISDIYKTSVCPLAKVMRKELKSRNINQLKVVYSKEEPIKIENRLIDENTKKQTPGSISFVPSVAGLLISSQIIKDIIK